MYELFIYQTWRLSGQHLCFIFVRCPVEELGTEILYSDSNIFLVSLLILGTGYEANFVNTKPWSSILIKSSLNQSASCHRQHTHISLLSLHILLGMGFKQQYSGHKLLSVLRFLVVITLNVWQEVTFCACKSKSTHKKKCSQQVAAGQLTVL